MCKEMQMVRAKLGCGLSLLSVFWSQEPEI